MMMRASDTRTHPIRKTKPYKMFLQPGTCRIGVIQDDSVRKTAQVSLSGQILKAPGDRDRAAATRSSPS